VVRVVSPGTLTDANYLDAREPAFLMSACLAAGARAFQASGTLGVALLDLSTGEFTAAEYAGDDGMLAFADELAVLKPREIVVPDGHDGSAAVALPQVASSGLPITPIESWAFDVESARRTLVDQFRAGGLEGFGLDGHSAATAAAGALVHHLRATQK